MLELTGTSACLAKANAASYIWDGIPHVAGEAGALLAREHFAGEDPGFLVDNLNMNHQCTFAAQKMKTSHTTLAKVKPTGQGK